MAIYGNFHLGMRKNPFDVESSSKKELARVEGFAVLSDLEMQVVSRRGSGGADPSDHLARFNGLSLLYAKTAAMSVSGRITIRVSNHD
jgi:hypothetical protein